MSQGDGLCGVLPGSLKRVGYGGKIEALSYIQAKSKAFGLCLYTLARDVELHSWEDGHGRRPYVQ